MTRHGRRRQAVGIARARGRAAPASRSERRPRSTTRARRSRSTATPSITRSRRSRAWACKRSKPSWPRAANSRMDSTGRAVAPAVARSASKSSDTERAVYAPRPDATSGPRALPRRRRQRVLERYATRTRAERASTASCGIGANPPADEDDFEGTVTLGNQAPTVTLSGPASVRAKEPATFRATASGSPTARSAPTCSTPSTATARTSPRHPTGWYGGDDRLPQPGARGRSACRCSTTRAPRRSRPST